jgi:ribosomal protein L40E
VSRVASEHTLGIDGRQVLASCIGASWAIACYEPDCNATVVGYRGRDHAVKGGMAHLMWHVHGKPTCRDCGAWLSHRTARRCRKGTCEASS